jgi:pimeloyl-ACP methyl ester carboxylesterase
MNLAPEVPMRRLMPAATLALSLVSLPSEGQTSQGFLETPDGVRLYYEKSGSGASTLILPGRLFLYPDFRFLENSFTVIVYDMRNRGRSDFVRDGSLLTVEHDVQDLEAVRRHFGVERFGTIGYSYLGKMVVFYALRHPERVDRIVQIGAVPMALATEYPAGLRNDDRDRVLDAQGLEKLRRRREENFHLEQPEKYCEEEWLVTRVLLVGDPAKAVKLGGGNCSLPNEWPTNFVRHLFHHFGSMSRFDLTADDVAGIRHPVLTIHGTKDRNAPYGAGLEWAEKLPNARLLTAEGAGHQAWVDRPELLAAIREFLGGL